MKYNSVENFQNFAKEQFDWCLKNGIKDFSIWSNGVDLQAVPDNKSLGLMFMRGELKNKGYWRCLKIVDGVQVNVL